MTTSSIAVLNPRFIYGLNTDVKGNVQHISDDEIIYPVGCLMAVHNMPQRRQKFIRLPDRGMNVNIIAVSPNK